MNKYQEQNNRYNIEIDNNYEYNIKNVDNRNNIDESLPNNRFFREKPEVYGHGMVHSHEKPKVINLSQNSLTPTQVKILSKGL